MATALRYPIGHQFFGNGATPLPLNAGKLFYYEATTSDLVDTFSDADGLVPNENPIILNAVGKLESPVYLSSAQDYKERLEDSAGNLILPWPDDNIPAAPTDVEAVSSATAKFQWVTKNADETLAASGFVGKALLGDSTGATITLTLPSAVAVGNGIGGLIAKGVAANTVVINTQGGQTISGASSLTLTAINHTVYLIADGANWRIALEYLPDGALTAARLAASFISALTELKTIDRTADFWLFWDASAPGFRKVAPKFIDKREPDALHSLVVSDKDLTAPPGSPAEGDRYIVGAGATGAWASQDGKVASYFDSAWAFYTPVEGWFTWVLDEDLLYRHTGSAWVADAVNHASQGIVTANGARLQIKSLSEEVTLSGATTDSTIAFPNPSLSLGASVRVTQLITASGGGASFTVGDAGSASRYGTISSFTVGTSNAGVIGPTGYYGSDDEIRFTVNTGAFTGGKVRVTIWYMELTPPTS